MRIIKEGRNPRYLYHFRCFSCGCEFETEDRNKVVKKFFRNDFYFIAKCPTCGEFASGKIERLQEIDE